MNYYNPEKFFKFRMTTQMMFKKLPFDVQRIIFLDYFKVLLCLEENYNVWRVEIWCDSDCDSDDSDDDLCSHNDHYLLTDFENYEKIEMVYYCLVENENFKIKKEIQNFFKNHPFFHKRWCDLWKINLNVFKLSKLYEYLDVLTKFRVAIYFISDKNKKCCETFKTHKCKSCLWKYYIIYKCYKEFVDSELTLIKFLELYDFKIVRRVMIETFNVKNNIWTIIQ